MKNLLALTIKKFPNLVGNQKKILQILLKTWLNFIDECKSKKKNNLI